MRQQLTEDERSSLRALKARAAAHGWLAFAVIVVALVALVYFGSHVIIPLLGSPKGVFATVVVGLCLMAILVPAVFAATASSRRRLKERHFQLGTTARVHLLHVEETEMRNRQGRTEILTIRYPDTPKPRVHSVFVPDEHAHMIWPDAALVIQISGTDASYIRVDWNSTEQAQSE